jgi:hypothetical protein
VVWRSSRTDVATIEQNSGVAVALEVGSTEISASMESPASGNLMANQTLTVLPPGTPLPPSFTMAASGVFNTDDGTFEGTPVAGWDPAAHQLTVNTFAVPAGMSLSVIGGHPLSVAAQGDVTLAGTLQFNGTSGAVDLAGGDGGAIKIVTSANILGAGGEILARGGQAPSGADGGDGGQVELTAVGGITIGTIDVDGGNSDDGGSAGGGRGGGISVLAGGTYSSTSVSANGGRGGGRDGAFKDGGGAGGTISITATGSVAPTSASANGGAGGTDGPYQGGNGGDGGTITLSSTLAAISASTVQAVGGAGGAGLAGGDGGDGGSLTFSSPLPLSGMVTSVLGGLGAAPSGAAGVNGSVTP